MATSSAAGADNANVIQASSKGIDDENFVGRRQRNEPRHALAPPLRKGFEVVIAVDGEQAVAMAQSENPDLILMDMSLPGHRRLGGDRRSRPTSDAHIPVIALTAHAMCGDREKAIEAGCDDYDTKPIEMPRLLEKIERCLARTQG